ncbi:hypothetical protein DAEQUDRAFT_731057 [Daedalea quercina L-15889]|uniref:RRM Nup35-type domain-containing protein n=1 Tax=Daedalea quercina L-15889 TaxID=1314783 RepID=A0A165MJA6_9APHY|nr:hypothetical protein DAEQUDRAFT_731057 [Daedalea quercina L-15889]
MYSSYNTGSENRSQYAHSHSHSAHQGFTVAGMSGSSTLQNPGLRGGPFSGGGLGLSSSASFGSGSSLATLGESRSHYQPGYLMSASQDNGLQQGSQRHDEAPLVQTKAKLSHSLVGGSASDFGMDSMFESARSRHRHRQPLDDEDAPPTTSINDIVDEVYTDSGSSRHSLRTSAFDPSTSRPSLFRSTHPSTPRPNHAAQSGSTAQPLQLVVFGYPPDKYSLTVEYFKSLGETTDAEQHPDISNCFRIGYINPSEAMRAVRKNGDVLSGSWMIGVKWADPAQAEAILGSAFARSELGVPGSPPVPAASPSNNDIIMSSSTSANIFPSASSRMSVDEPGFGASTPTVGTPIRLAPSAAAFRKPGAGSPVKAVQGMSNAVAPSPGKGVLEQVGDLIFGW